MLNNRLVNLRYQDMFFRLGKNKFVESNVWEKCFWPKNKVHNLFTFYKWLIFSWIKWLCLSVEIEKLYQFI